MLRESALLSGMSVDLRGITDLTIDLGIPAARPLLAFTEVLIGGDEVTDEREDLVAVVGEAAAARAALTAGNFEMMNRIVDSTGVPVPSSMSTLLAELGV